MPTPTDGYRLADGARVPGTTTIIGRFKESGALIRWAYNQGKAGVDLYASRDRAADIGTAAHAMVEARIKGDGAVTPDMVLDDLAKGHDNPDEFKERARSSYGAYLSWERMTRLEVIDQEMQLVSEEYRFGGTPDAIGQIDGSLVLLDWKTSNGVYPDFLIQLAAYRHLWEENHPDKPITGGFHLLRFAKEHGDFAHHYYPNLDEAWRQFVLLREAYDIDKQLKKRAA